MLDVTDPANAKLLNNSAIYLSANMHVKHKGADKTVFVVLQKVYNENNGAKWIFVGVRPNVIYPPQETVPYIIPPTNNEVNFLSLNRLMKTENSSAVWVHFPKEGGGLSELKIAWARNELEFINMDNLNYHILDFDGWIVSVREFVRENENSGWLIDQIIQADIGAKEDYKKLILNIF